MTTLATDPHPVHGELDPELYDLSLPAEKVTEKDDTKMLPCATCKRPLIASRFAVPKKTACTACRGASASATVSGDPFAADLDLEERQRRITGKRLVQRFRYPGQRAEIEQAHVVLKLLSFDGETVVFIAQHGGKRTMPVSHVVSVR